MTSLHPQLQRDCLLLGRFPLCHLLLMRDANHPWFILAPERDGITELYQLEPADQQQLMRESCHLSKVLAQQFQAHKMSVAALGNLVPQLHIHHIVRYRHDAAWPAPVWGGGGGGQALFAGRAGGGDGTACRGAGGGG